MFWKNKEFDDAKEILVSKNDEHNFGFAFLEREIRHSKSVIGGKLYDTEKAEYLCNFKDNRALFRAPKGNYFSCEVQNLKYCYGESCAYATHYCDIKPENIEYVKDIIGRYDVDKYIELFGEPEEA